MSVGVKSVDINYELGVLADRIKQGNCVLFLGPGVARLADGRTVNEAFSGHLVQKMKEEAIDYDISQQNNMPYLIQQYIIGKNEKFRRNSYRPVDVRFEYFNFIKNNPPDFGVYDDLAKLPFQLVINATYTKEFFTFFEKHHRGKRKIYFDYYDISNKKEGSDPSAADQKAASKAPPPGNNNFWVYNLLGLCEEASINSMVLTEQEIVRFVGRIHQAGTALPINITNHIDGDKYCLFLGFDFDQWYLKVVINTLLLGNQQGNDREKGLPDSLAFGVPSSYPTAFFYEDAYRFYFVPDDISKFIKSLLPKVAEDERNIMPALPESPLSIVFMSDINSKEDTSLRNQIYKKYLEPLIKGYAVVWSEDLSLGSDKDEKTFEKIENADVVIAMVSVDFVDSGKYKMTEEKLVKNTKSHLKRIAILLRPTPEGVFDRSNTFTWLSETKTGDGKPTALNQFDENVRENEINKIASFIKDCVFDIIRNK